MKLSKLGFIQFASVAIVGFLIAIILIVGNLLIVDIHLFSKKNDQTETSPPITTLVSDGNLTKTDNTSVNTTPTPQVVDNCGTNCQSIIDKKLAQLKSELLVLIQQNNQTTIQTQTSTQNNTNLPKELFVNLGSNGTTRLSNWTDLSGSEITFNPANYPGTKSFTFQASLSTDAGDRTVYSRVYDVTHGVGVQGSDINYTGSSWTLVESSPMTFLSGSLTLRIQFKSLNGNVANIESPRIRIIY